MVGALARGWLALAVLVLQTMPALALSDPLDSARWGDMQRLFFGDAPLRFDDRVRVLAPLAAENPMEVPITVDASALPGVVEVMVFADFNPILKVLSFEPVAAEARLSFRVKLQQSTPVRAAARTADGQWHVGGTWVNTTGGGCSAPSVGSASPAWLSRLGQVSGRLWSRPEGARLRVRIIHPMDTGLAADIPAFYLESLEIRSGAGAPLMRIHAFEPVSENPLFTVDLPGHLAPGEALAVSGRDNNGNRIDARVAP